MSALARKIFPKRETKATHSTYSTAFWEDKSLATKRLEEKLWASPWKLQVYPFLNTRVELFYEINEKAK